MSVHRFRSELMHSKDGKLYMRLHYGPNYSLLHAIPESISNAPISELKEYLESIVPKLMKELKDMFKGAQKKLRRKQRNEKKQQAHSKKDHSKTNGTAKSFADGKKRVSSVGGSHH